MKVNITFGSSVDGFRLCLAEESDFRMEFDAGSIPVKADPYEGSYTIIPSVLRQVLDTENKLCSADIQVMEIPYFEVTNTSGKTAIIGG